MLSYRHKGRTKTLFPECPASGTPLTTIIHPPLNRTWREGRSASEGQGSNVRNLGNVCLSVGNLHGFHGAGEESSLTGISRFPIGPQRLVRPPGSDQGDGGGVGPRRCRQLCLCRRGKPRTVCVCTPHQTASWSSFWRDLATHGPAWLCTDPKHTISRSNSGFLLQGHLQAAVPAVSPWELVHHSWQLQNQGQARDLPQYKRGKTQPASVCSHSHPHLTAVGSRCILGI